MSQSSTGAAIKRPGPVMRWVIRRGGALHNSLYRRGIAQRLQGQRLILLTTTGRKSGRKYTTPLGVLREGDAYVVIASAGGADWDPSWWVNMKANPEVVVEDGKQKVRARMEEVKDPVERERLWAKVVAAMPGYARYPKKTSRVIPLGILRPIAS